MFFFTITRATDARNKYVLCSGVAYSSGMIFPLEMAVSIFRVLKVREGAYVSRPNEMVHTW
jgi:hypothetical protein